MTTSRIVALATILAAAGLAWSTRPSPTIGNADSPSSSIVASSAEGDEPTSGVSDAGPTDSPPARLAFDASPATTIDLTEVANSGATDVAHTEQATAPTIDGSPETTVAVAPPSTGGLATVAPVTTETDPNRPVEEPLAALAAGGSPTLGLPALPLADSDRPDPVALLRITGSTERSVTVSWVAELDDRRRSFDLFVDDEWVGWIDGTWTTSHTFTGLEPGTDYRFGVTAVGDPDEVLADRHYSTRTLVTARTAGSPIPEPQPPVPEPPAPAPDPGDPVNPPVGDCGTSTEAICVAWPVGFVNGATGQQLDVNGVNIIDWFNGNWRYDLASRLAAPGSPQFNSLRVVMSWAEMQPTPGTIDPQALAHLDALIAEAEASGFTVILDPIHVARTRSRQWNENPGSAWNMPAWAWSEAGITPAPSRDAQLDDTYNCGADNVLRTAAAIDYLSFLVDRYAEVDNVIAIDLVNEPRNSCWGSQLSGEPVSGDAPSGDLFENATAAEAAQDLVDLQVDWIDHLRTIDVDKVFIAAAMYGDFDVRALDLTALAAHDNVMWSIHDYYAGVAPSDHFYNPDGQSKGIVSHESERSERCGGACYDYGVSDRAARKASMGRYLDLTIAELARYELPLFVGEYGFHNSVANFGDALADKYDLYEERGLARAVWVANYDQAFELHNSAGWNPAAVGLTGGRIR